MNMEMTDMATQNLLPDEFNALEPLVSQWALPTQNERQQSEVKMLLRISMRLLMIGP